VVALETIPLFRHLNRAELQALRLIAQERRFATGQEIFHEGAPGDGVYFVKNGLVEISSGTETKKVFSRLGPGEIFGEMAVIELRPRSATASAAQDTEVFFFCRGAKCSPSSNIHPHWRSPCFSKSAAVSANSTSFTSAK